MAVSSGRSETQKEFVEKLMDEKVLGFSKNTSKKSLGFTLKGDTTASVTDYAIKLLNHHGMEPQSYYCSRRNSNSINLYG